MSADCYHINTLQHNGSSQDGRHLAALDPANTPIDGRSMGDLVLFAQQYARLLNFYNTSNTIAGDWQNFIAGDITTILASIVTADYNTPLATYYKYFNKLETATDADKDEWVKVMFDVSFSLLDAVRGWNEKLVLNSAAKQLLSNEINSYLSYAFASLLYYYYAAIHIQWLSDNTKHGYIDTGYTGDPSKEDYHYQYTQDVLKHNFTKEWLTQTGFPTLSLQEITHKLDTTPALLADTNKIFGQDPASTDDTHPRLFVSAYYRNVFTAIYNSYVRIITTAKQYFQQTLDSFAYHSPNNGLMLAFFRLFGLAQNAINTLTGKHLDFYYNKVLQLNRKQANPDSVHVVFTLAKNVNSFTVEAGTPLFAGKDATGKELLYTTDKTISLNKGQVSALKSVFFDTDATNGGLFAAEAANSADGKGKPLPQGDPSWFAYGQRQEGLDSATQTMTEVAPGFVIASPILQLSEGRRVITIRLYADDIVSMAANALVDKLNVYITGKKGWIPCGALTTTVTDGTANAVKVDHTEKCITIVLVLDAAAESTAPVNTSVHKESYATQWPVVKVLLDTKADPALYTALCSKKIKKIQAKVGVTGAMQCVLYSDAGSMENKAPFMPFGPRPKKGTSFYFGSYEVFSKAVSKLTLHFNWMGVPTGSINDYYSYDTKPGTDPKKTRNYITNSDTVAIAPDSFTVQYSVKDAGVFGDDSGTGKTKPLFQANSSKGLEAAADITINNVLAASNAQMDTFTAYSPDLKRGFLRLRLDEPDAAFGHDAYIKTFTQQVVLYNKDTINNSLPNEPYTPVTKPLTYDYDAEENIELTATTYNVAKGQYFQLFPFGYAEVKDNTGKGILQKFNYHDKDTSINLLQGALYIGIQQINAGEQLSLYIEFSEGSEDGSVDPVGIYWSYLANNEWVSLKPSLVSDTTNNMLGSGIVRFTIPADMNEDNTLMPAGAKWIRAGIDAASTADAGDNYKAYPKAYAVYTNGVKAMFANNGNDANHLAAPLPPQKITRLYRANASIKQVLQPYESFDGRTVEQDGSYFTRISERLRHKNRAITIWDYERLVLQQFSMLYKAKCLNHTSDDTEIAPGCVRIIVIPDMSNKTTGDVFKPAVSNNRRQNIYNYITALNCPFANLKVENPQYEAIRVNCEIQFAKDLVFEEYRLKLMDDIDKFLAPWAYSESHGIDFGGRIHRSKIIKFIEDLYYVDYLTDFSLDLFVKGSQKLTAVDEVTATTSKSILTTYKEHNIGNNTCKTVV